MFDSYGYGPEMYNLENKLPNSEIIVFNTEQLQSLASEVCEHYCLSHAVTPWPKLYLQHFKMMPEIMIDVYTNMLKII